MRFEKLDTPIDLTLPTDKIIKTQDRAGLSVLRTLLQDGLHLRPGVLQLPVIQDIALAVGECGECGVVSIRVQVDWPMD